MEHTGCGGKSYETGAHATQKNEAGAERSAEKQTGGGTPHQRGKCKNGNRGSRLGAGPGGLSTVSARPDKKARLFTGYLKTQREGKTNPGRGEQLPREVKMQRSKNGGDWRR